MPRILLILAVLPGLSGCAGPIAEPAGVCLGTRADAQALRRALLAHPQTPGPVGEAGTDLVIGLEAACKA